MIQSYRDLEIWKRSMGLAKDCYLITRGYPKDELFGMTTQIRRASGSIPANIAEGHGRESTGDFIRFLRIAQGSLKEVETHLILSVDVMLLAKDQAEPLLSECDQIGRMVRALIRSLQASLASNS